MANQIMWLADQFLTRKTTDFDKSIIAVGNNAIEISGGDQTIFLREGFFPLSNWEVVAYMGDPRLVFV